jgi:hypothetical protein
MNRIFFHCCATTQQTECATTFGSLTTVPFYCRPQAIK